MTVLVVTTITSGETAPTAMEAAFGYDIPDTLGHMVVKVIGSNKQGAVELDMSSEPPTLRLRDALCTLAFGELRDGVFARDIHLPSRLQYASSEFTGPGSELQLRDYL